jgi:hypothetical protein
MAVKPTCFCDPGPNVMGFAAQVGAGIGRSRFGFGLRSERNELIDMQKYRNVRKSLQMLPESLSARTSTFVGSLATDLAGARLRV